MGLTKEAYYRYLAYDKCLRKTARKYTWQELVEAANRALSVHSIKGIKKAQFYRDKEALKAPPWSAPIVSESGLYSYSNPDYSILNLPMNDEESEHLKSALMVLSRFKGLPQFEWIHEIIPKIEKQFEFESQSIEVVGFDQNIDLKGLHHFEELFNAIVNKQVLSIDYKSFKQNDQIRLTIHPYYLKQYNNRWYLFGFNPEYENLSNPALDRIIAITPLEKEKYIDNTRYDFNEYFEDMIGVTKFDDRKSQIVKLWFESEQAHYIDTKPLHGTQKLTWQDDGSAIVTIDVIPNMELEHLILRFAEKCKILEPLDLVNRIAERLKMASSNY